MKTNYYVAVNWLGTKYIKCNEIKDIDPSVKMNIEKNIDPDDICQWYLSDLDYYEKECLQKYFPELIFTYSDMLELWVLCCDKLGYSWSFEMTETTIEQAVRKEGEDI